MEVNNYETASDSELPNLSDMIYFLNPFDESQTPLQYFKTFFTEDLLGSVTSENHENCHQEQQHSKLS